MLPVATPNDAPNPPIVQLPVVPARPLLLSLFCGSGGLDWGFWEAGYQIALAADIFPAAVRTHDRNHRPHGTKTLHLDLSTTAPQELKDLWDRQADRQPIGIIGGPPCQAFSVSNVYQREDDPRRQMPRHYAQIVDYFNSHGGIDFFLFENVEGLLNQKHEAAFNEFKELCDRAGFRIYQKLIDAIKFGLPQFRERIIVVGINKERYPDIGFDIPEGSIETPEIIDSVLRGLPEPVFNERGMHPEGIPFHPNHWTFKVLSPKFTNGTILPGQAWGRSFRALEWGTPSRTVAYGHREVHVHPNCHRRLSIYEAMRLQGFPHNYVLEGNISDQVTLVSDAVPPPVGRAMGVAIANALHLHTLPPQNGEAGEQMPNLVVANE